MHMHMHTGTINTTPGVARMIPTSARITDLQKHQLAQNFVAKAWVQDWLYHGTIAMVDLHTAQVGEERGIQSKDKIERMADYIDANRETVFGRHCSGIFAANDR